MGYEAIISALSVLFAAALLAIGKLVMVMRKSSDDSRGADAKIVIEKLQAKADEWGRLYEEMQKRIDDSFSKMTRVETELQGRIDKIQAAHLECQIELSACKTQYHEATTQLKDLHERLAVLERRA